RRARQKQQQRGGGGEASQDALLVQPLAKSTVAHLVMVLQHVHELPGGPIEGWRPSRLFATAEGRLTLVQPAVFDASRDFLERPLVIRVVALVVARQVPPQTVAKIVCPHRV